MEDEDDTEADTAQPNAETTTPVDNADRPAGVTQDASAGFTPEQQVKVDAIAASARKQGSLSVYKELGDVDALKAKAAKFDELEVAKLSEMDKLKQQLTDKDTEIATANKLANTERLDALRLRVGLKVGMAPEIAELLKGDTEEAMQAHAVVVLAAMKIEPGARIPNIDATAGGGQSGSGTSHPDLTAEQIAAAVKSNIPLDTYAKALAQVTGE